VISQQATAVGATLVDVNALFTKVANSGITINGYTGTTGFLGGVFSLDGIHPTNTGYAVVANTFIDTMNTTIATKIPDIDLGSVTATDPLWPPNVAAQAAGATPMSIAAGIGRKTDDVMLGSWKR
jgi:hypothetical protein